MVRSSDFFVYLALAVSKSHTAFNAREFGSLEKRNNELRLTITNGYGPVEKIRLEERTTTAHSS